MASTWDSTNTSIIPDGVGLRRNDLTLWKRYVAFSSDGDYEMFCEIGIGQAEPAFVGSDLLNLISLPSPLPTTLPCISNRAILNVMLLARTRAAHIPRAWFSPTCVTHSMTRRAVTYKMTGRITYATHISFRRFLAFGARGDEVLGRFTPPTFVPWWWLAFLTLCCICSWTLPRLGDVSPYEILR